MQLFLHDLTPANSSIYKDSYHAFVLHAALVNVKYWYTPVLVSVGIVSNLLVFLTLSNKKFSQVTCIPYFSALAMTDSVMLLVLLLVWLQVLDINVDMYNSGGWCQAMSYLSSSSAFLAVWLITWANIDRCFTITCLQRFTANCRCTPLRAKIIVCALCIIAIAVYLNISLLMGVVTTQFGPLCVPLPAFAGRVQFLSRADLFVNFLLPYTVIIVTCLLCACKLCVLKVTPRERRSVRAPSCDPVLPIVLARRQSHQRSNAIRLETETIEENNLEIKLTKAAVVIFILFLTLTLPTQLLRTWVNLSVLFREKHYVAMSQTFYLWQQLLMYAFFTRFACNGFVFLAVIPEYRHELQRLCTYTLRRKRNTRDENVSTSVLSVTTPLSASESVAGPSAAQSPETECLTSREDLSNVKI